MKRRSINLLIILAVVSFAGILITQIYWVRQAYSVQEKEINDRIVIAMSTVVQDIMAIKKDSSVVEPVQQVANNFYVANINDTLHPYLLETLLKDEFTASNLRSDFEYGIYDCFNDSIVFGGKVSFGEEGSQPAKEISFQRKFDKDGHYFGIYYPQKSDLIFGNMKFWTFSTIMLLIVVTVFVYAIMIILKQKRLSEVRTDFINNMTHELKTPISTIAISSQALTNDQVLDDPQRLKQYAKIIQAENHRLKTQVDKVLQIATLSAEKVEMQQGEVNMDQLITSACQSNQLLADQLGGKITYENLAENFTIQGDEVHLTNILYNLLDNALKYCEETPEIKIQTSNKKGKLLVSIRDNGIGIPPKYKTLVFDRFFRVPTGNQHDVKGFGLGLHYVKAVVEAHGGTVEVDSQLGQGSTFQFEIPCL
ncbi:MAG: HAMP domain-containing sensor histidine kinase [Bacteroidota bacterium]